MYCPIALKKAMQRYTLFMLHVSMQKKNIKIIQVTELIYKLIFSNLS